MKTKKNWLGLLLRFCALIGALVAVYFLAPRMIPQEEFRFAYRIPESETEMRQKLVDTACAWAVAEDYVNHTGDKTPMVVLSTASPYKFPTAVLGALEQTALTDEFRQMDRLHELTGVEIPQNLTGLEQAQELHTGLCSKDAMLDLVRGL